MTESNEPEFKTALELRDEPDEEIVEPVEVPNDESDDDQEGSAEVFEGP